MKITGVFKLYDDLRLAYGLSPSDDIDEEFDAFLKKIAGRDCVLTNYTPTSKTFDTTLWGEDPERPGSGIMVYQYLDGRSRRYGDNMGIDKLASINETATTEYIYCTNCGFIASKATRYDFEPRFTYGDIFDQNIAGNPNNPTTITGVDIPIMQADLNHRMYCPKHRGTAIFKTVQDSFLP